MARVHKLLDLTWPRVGELARDRSVVFLLSSPIEQHGPHLPLGTDLLQAAAVMDQMAARVADGGWNVLVAPALPYTTAVLSRNYPGSVSVRSRNAVPFFTDILNSFASNGLRDIVVVSQHIDPPHVLAWEDSCRRAAAETGARAIEGDERLIFDDIRSGVLADVLGVDPAGDSHAGVFETSVVMAVRPELVVEEERRALPAVPLDYDRDLRGARDFRDLGDGRGYTGDPSRASAALGGRLVVRYAEAFGELVLAHLSGADVWPRLTITEMFPRVQPPT